MSGCVLCLGSGVSRIDGCLAPCICELGAFQRKRNNRLALEAYTKAKKEPVIVPPNPPPTSASLHAQWMLTPAETGPIPMAPNVCQTIDCNASVLQDGDVCESCREEAHVIRQQANMLDPERGKSARIEALEALVDKQNEYIKESTSIHKDSMALLKDLKYGWRMGAAYAIGYACGVLSMVLVAVVKGWL